MSVDLNHVVEGPRDAPVVVLGNSLGTNLAIWDAVVAELSPHLRVVRYDHRGHGDSSAPPGPYDIADLGRDVLSLLDTVGVDRAAYCGVSMGGMVGLWLAAHAPERVEALGAFCTSACPGNPEAWAQRAATVTAAGSTAPIVDAVVSRWVTPDFAAQHPDDVAALREMLLGSPPLGYAACCGVLERIDLRGVLAGIRAPTLVVGGAQDQALPPDHAERIAAAIPGAAFELLDPAAHIPMVERPDAVAGLILDHLRARR